MISTVVTMYGSSFQVFTHFTHAHFVFLHNAVTTLFIMVLGGSGAYNTIFKIELLVKIILSKNLNKKNVLESFFYYRLISFPLFLDCCLTKKEYQFKFYLI